MIPLSYKLSFLDIVTPSFPAKWILTIDTIQNIQTIVNRSKRRAPNTKIAISSVIVRKDRAPFAKQIVDLNKDLKMFAQDNLLDFICNDNIDETCLGIKRVHLNKKGNSFFVKNLINYFDTLC